MAQVDEIARTRCFPGLAFRGDAACRRSCVIGSGLDVWEIIQMLEDLGSIEQLIEHTQLTEHQVRLAVAYRDTYPDEIAAAIAENRRPVQVWRQHYPFVHFTATP